jgi:hypothetical protein
MFTSSTGADDGQRVGFDVNDGKNQDDTGRNTLFDPLPGINSVSHESVC